MKYMILINLGPEARNWQSLPEHEQKKIAAAWGAVNQTPGITPGMQLQPPETATTVRAQDGKVVTTDGPYIETKEALDGYCVFEGDDLDAAIELASKIPAALYGELATLTGSPVVELNRAVAVAEAEGPQAGLDIVDTLPLQHYRYLHSTRAELLRRLGRTDEARDEYAKAIADFADTPERRLLEQRMADLSG